MKENVQRNLRYTSPIEHKALVKWSRAPQFDLPMFLIESRRPLGLDTFGPNGVAVVLRHVVAVADAAQ